MATPQRASDGVPEPRQTAAERQATARQGASPAGVPSLRLVGGDAAVVPSRRLGLSVAAWQTLAGATALRLFTAAVAFATTYWLGARLTGARHLQAPAERLARHPLTFVFSAWRHWDSFWFLRVAAHGYARRRAAAFFPLYPLTVNISGRLLGSMLVGGVLVSVLCYALALVVLYRLVAHDFDERVALWTVLFLSAAGTSLFFQAIYSESLFLLLTVTSFWAGRTGRWWLAGAAGLLAALTRSAGVVLVAPLLWMWLEQRRGRAIALPGGARHAALLSRAPGRLPSLAWLALVPAGIGLYMAYTSVRYHNALLFVAAEHDWHRRLSPPTTAIYQGALAARRSVQHIAAQPSAYFAVARPAFRVQWLTIGNLTAFIALVLALALVAVCWRRLPAPYTIMALVSLLVPLSYPTHSTPLLSMPRFALVVFPLFVALAVLLARHLVLRWLVLAVMVAGLVLFTAMFANGMWVA